MIVEKLVKAMSGLWPLAMVGPMVPSAYLDQQISGDIAYGASLWELSSDQCLSWLEMKPPKSVIYVSFGSMVDITAKQAEEIAFSVGCKRFHKQVSNRIYEFNTRKRIGCTMVQSTTGAGTSGCGLLCDTLWLELNIGGLEPRSANGSNATVEGSAY